MSETVKYIQNQFMRFINLFIFAITHKLKSLATILILIINEKKFVLFQIQKKISLTLLHSCTLFKFKIFYSEMSRKKIKINK